MPISNYLITSCLFSTTFAKVLQLNQILILDPLPTVQDDGVVPESQADTVDLMQAFEKTPKGESHPSLGKVARTVSDVSDMREFEDLVAAQGVSEKKTPLKSIHTSTTASGIQPQPSQTVDVSSVTQPAEEIETGDDDSSPNTHSTAEVQHAENSASRASRNAVDDLSKFEADIAPPKKKDSGAEQVGAAQSQMSNPPQSNIPSSAASAASTGTAARDQTSPLQKMVPTTTPGGGVKTGGVEVAPGVEPLQAAGVAVVPPKGHTPTFKALEPDTWGAKCDPDFERQQCNHLACIDGGCKFCSADTDCHAPRYRCFGPKKEESCNGMHGCTCHHKSFFPIVPADIEALVLAFLATALAASGGIGGGGLLVPLFILVEDFEADLASPLSSATITGGAIVGYYLYCFRWHPLFPIVQRPLIDYETVLIILPSLLTGTMIGTIFDKILPIWFIMSMLFILLIFTTYRTAKKGFDTLSKESTERELKGEQTDSDADDGGAAEYDMVGDGEIGNGEKITGTRFPKDTLTMIVVFWLFIFSISGLKGGGHGEPSILPFVECNNDWYWFMQVCCWMMMLVMFIYVREQVVYNGEGGLDGDIVWTPMNSLTLPALCLPCGLFAGLLGVGGGMVVGPLLLELGARHSTVVATSTFTILVTASSSAVQFVMMGDLPIFYAIFFAMVGGVGTMCGQLIVERIIAQFRSTSIIVFGIAAVIGSSTIAMGYTGVRSIARTLEVNGNMGLRNLCA